MDATDEIEVNVDNGFCVNRYICYHWFTCAQDDFSWPLRMKCDFFFCQDTLPGVGQLSRLLIPFMRCHICLVMGVVLVLCDSIVSFSSILCILQ
jgi:hypothetical protein